MLGLFLFLAFTMPTESLPNDNGGMEWVNVSRNPEHAGIYNVIVRIGRTSFATTGFWNGKYWDKEITWWQGPI